MKQTRIVGTITRAFDGALDGMSARLVRIRRLGYTVELVVSAPPFQQGDHVHLSPAEFILETARTRAAQQEA